MMGWGFLRDGLSRMKLFDRLFFVSLFLGFIRLAYFSDVIALSLFS